MVNTPPATKKPAPAKSQPPTYTPNEGDIIDDILRMVIAMAPGFSTALAAQIDKKAREQWGGDRPYIKLRGQDEKARNEAIKRDYWQHGAHIALLERRYSLSARRIWYILKS